MSDLNSISDSDLRVVLADTRRLLRSEQLSGTVHAALQKSVRLLVAEAEEHGLDPNAPEPKGLAAFTDGEILRRWQHARAVLRRRGVHPRLPRELPKTMRALEREARSRRVELHGSMERPSELRFRIEADPNSGNVTFHDPPQPERNRPPKAPNATPPADLLTALEASIQLQVNGNGHAPNGNGQHRNGAV